MVNSEELTGTTESLTLQTRCSIKRRRYNRVRLYLPIHVGLCIQRDLEKSYKSSVLLRNLFVYCLCHLVSTSSQPAVPKHGQDFTKL